MSFRYDIIIPARYGSTRLPGKPLLDIAGKPLIQHVYEAARDSDADQVIIATDDERILKTAQGFGAEVIMTAADHTSGTDRLAEAATLLNKQDDAIIVNLQGDEVGMSINVITQAARALHDNPQVNMATICEPIAEPKHIQDPNVVKVVCDKNDLALYFSRSAIPWNVSLDYGHDQDRISEDFICYRHIGLYAYRVGFLKRYTNLPKCPLEQQESLEQLRALYHGEKIHVSLACEPTGVGIDTPDDLEQARTTLAKSVPD